jgi:hypothetical protein
MELIIDLIVNGYECDYLDYKERQYSKEKYMDLIKDIMAMANSHFDGEKYIIIGIKDLPEGKVYKGIVIEEFIDSSVYIDIIHNYIEPDINFDYFKLEFDGKCFGIFKIFNNIKQPYMVKKKYDPLHEGYCLIRKGSRNTIAKRNDFDLIYQKNKETTEIIFREEMLYAVHESDGCASIEVLISNHTNKPVTFVAGALFISNQEDKELSIHPVYGLGKFEGANFQISLRSNSEVVDKLYVGFETTDPFRLGLDEYGTSDQVYNMKLILCDARDNQYQAFIEGRVFAKGDFLWKVRKAKGIKHRFKSH